MTHTVFVCFNGPPRSGKTTAATLMGQTLNIRFPKATVHRDSFAAPMKQYIATALGIKYNEVDKDAPRDDLNGYSIRNFLIYESEEVVKPRYGTDAFGSWLRARTEALHPGPDFVLVDDSGFEAEFSALPSAKILIRVVRPGTDFAGDSRSYWGDPDWALFNDGGLDRLQRSVDALIDDLAEYKGWIVN